MEDTDDTRTEEQFDEPRRVRPEDETDAEDGDGDPTPGAPGADDTMEDVSHTPPNGDGANRVFERGTEGRDDTV